MCKPQYVNIQNARRVSVEYASPGKSKIVIRGTNQNGREHKVTVVMEDYNLPEIVKEIKSVVDGKTTQAIYLSQRLKLVFIP